MAIVKKKEDVSKLSFEEAIDKLTAIVSGIESGQTPLQQSLEQYENGMELIRHCRSILAQAEKRIEKIAEEQAEDKK